MTNVSRALCILYLVLYVLTDIKHSYVLTFVLIGTISLRIFASGRTSSLLFISYLCITYLYIPATLQMIATGYYDPLPYLVLAVLGLDFINYFSEIPKFSFHRPALPTQIYFLIWSSCLALASTGTLLFSGESAFMGLFSFIIPFAVSLVYFERLLPHATLAKLYLMIIAYLAVVGIYATFFWDGFGRILIGAYILMPVLIANQYRDFGLRPWQALVAAPPLLAAAHYIRNGGKWVSASELGRESVGHHLVLTMKLFEAPVYEYLGGVGKFLDQYLLFFLNWVPRDAWPGKPVGIGLYAVDEWIGRSGYGESYNVSLGMFGEQLYLTGPYFLFAWFFLLVTLVMSRRLIGKLSYDYVAPIVAFDVNVISYVWGGAASFGSRTWFFVVPMLATIVIWRFFDRRRCSDQKTRRLTSARAPIDRLTSHR